MQNPQRLLEINHAHLQLMESLLDEGKKYNIFKPVSTHCR